MTEDDWNKTEPLGKLKGSFKFNNRKIFLIVEKVLVCFVLVFLTLGIFFYGLLVNLGIIPTVELESYEVSGFIIMGLGVFFILFFLAMEGLPKKYGGVKDD